LQEVEVKNQMKIHWVAPHFYPETGGVETHVEQISNYLIERGHSVTVHTSAVSVTRETLPETGELGDIKIKRYRPSFNRSFYMSRFKPAFYLGDIIIMEGYPSLTNDYIVKKYYGKFPMVIYIQGVVLPVTGTARRMKGLYDAMVGVKTLNLADRLIAMTDLEKKWCEGEGISTDKIEIIPNGIPKEAFKKYDGKAPKKKFGLNRYLLFVGRMYQEKAPLHLVNALDILKDDFPDLGVIFAGPDQGEAAKVSALAKDKGLKDRVVYAGKVDEHEKYELLAGCECLVLPSQFEAQGIVFIEAWTQKKPVIGTNVGGVPYIVKNNETGLLYDYGDIDALSGHIRTILEKPAEAKRLGENGFSEAGQNWRWPVVIDRIEKVYEEAIEEFARRGVQ
jgi:glycosyltransferase involved in cell wall biosynthesis